MPTTQQSLAATFALADAFQQLAPWEFLSDTPMMAYRNPETGEIWYCSILGANDEVYGMAMYPGTEGLRSLMRLLCPDETAAESMAPLLMFEQRAILLSFDIRRDLDAEDKTLLRAAGIRQTTKGRRRFPTFRSSSPGNMQAACSADDIVQLAPVLDAAMRFARAVREDGTMLAALESAAAQHGEPLWPIYVCESLDDAPANWRLELIDSRAAMEEPPLPACAVAPEELHRIRFATTAAPQVVWQIDWWYLPTPIATMVQLPQVIGIVDAATGRAFALETLQPEVNLSDAIGTAVLNAMRQHKCRPGTIAMASPARVAVLRTMCDGLQVGITVSPALDALNAMREQMLMDMMLQGLQPPNQRSAWE